MTEFKAEFSSGLADCTLAHSHDHICVKQLHDTHMYALICPIAFPSQIAFRLCVMLETIPPVAACDAVRSAQ